MVNSKHHWPTTADDYGFSPQVNQAILERVKHGTVQVVSVLANFVTPEEAQLLKKKLDPLYISAHINLVEGKPLSPAQEIPTLLNSQGHFRALPQFFFQLLTHQVDFLQVKKEMTAQIKHLRKLGLSPNYIDSHQHSHTLYPLWKVYVEVMKEEGIKKIRSVRSSKLYLSKRPLRLLIYVVFRFLMLISYGKCNQSQHIYHARIAHPGSPYD